MRTFLTLVAVLAFCSISFGQEYLVNGSFEDPPVPNPECEHPGGYGGAVTGWSGSGATNRNNSFYGTPCYDGLMHMSMTGWGSDSRMITQTVTGLTGGVQYELTGVWYLGHQDSFGNNTARAELRDGPNATDPLLGYAQKVQYQGSTGTWLPFSVIATLPPGHTTITVVIKTTNGGSTGFATHVDAVSLHPNQCVTPVDVADISPGYGARDTTVTEVTINGSGFIAGQTTVKLQKSGAPDIVATNVIVGSGGTSLSCDFNLAGAALGRWNVVVSNGNPFCQADALPSAFNVVLPAFTNGSFELPAAPKQCPVPPGGLGGGSGPSVTDWQVKEIALYGWNTVLYRDADIYTPTCNPLPDGLDHYGSTSSNNDGAAGAEAWIYQTVIAEAGKTYTFSGYFAGGGPNRVTIELHDGDELAPMIGETVVHDGGPAYDWSFAAVSGTPTGNLLSVVWHIDLNGPGPHAAHADGLTLLGCSNPISASSVNPTSVDNDGVKTLTIGGSGFSGGGTPAVTLTKAGGGSITCTNVVVVNDGQLKCDANLVGAAAGHWDIIVVKDGCVSRISEYGASLLVVGTFVNGEFEDPTAPQDCGPPPAQVNGIPAGWSADMMTGAFVRDSAVYVVTCPCPLSAGGHFGSMSSGSAGLMFAYQVVRVTPGQSYVFSGYFAGGGMNVVRLALIDGSDHLAIPLNEVIVRQHSGSGDPYESYDWIPGSVTATAASDVMTVVWWVEVTNDMGGTVPSTSHADGLSFGPPCANPPTVGTVVPASGSLGSTVSLTITGTNFAAGQTSVKLTKTGQSPIVATNVVVAGDGLSLTADVNLTGAAAGLWDVVVTTCADARKVNGFEVVSCYATRQDVDGDGDVDLTDFGMFQACFNGPNRPWPPPPLDQQKCRCLDADTDGDVDLADFGAFQACFNGPNRPPSCS